MRVLPWLLLLLGAFLAPPARAAEDEAATRYAQAVQAYREGDAATAANVWRRLYRTGAPGLDPAALAFDLGNAAYRLGRPLEAALWFEASVRHAPRDVDAWANLELARERAGLPPADRGDLADTLARLLHALTLAEAEWLLVLSALALALALAGRLWWGGAALRRATWALGALTLLALLPWAANLRRAGEPTWAVVERGGAELASEPRDDAPRVGRLEPGQRVEHVDALPGWVRVRAGERLSGWIDEDAVRDFGHAVADPR